MSRRAMHRRTALTALGSIALVRGTAVAGCPVPDTFTLEPGSLPATSASIAKRSLSVLTLGGASTLGGPAHGPEFTYPARLEARLSRALPGVTVTVTIEAGARKPDDVLLQSLEKALAVHRPALVIWGPGASAAARGDDLDTLMGTPGDVIAKIRGAGADLILMTLQYAPSVSRLVNLGPYRMAVIRSGDEAGIPVLDRYELMRFWSDSGFLDLDVTNADDRIRVSRTLYDCLAEILANAI